MPTAGLSCVLGLLGRQLLTLKSSNPSPNEATVSAPLHPSCPSRAPRMEMYTHGQAGRTPLFLQGLGAPVGALVGGPKDFIEEAWRLRKARVEGCARQGCWPQLPWWDWLTPRSMLQRDHQNAQRFARGA